MTALVLLRRRWHVSTDDFVFPGIFGALFHLAWAALLGAYIAAISRCELADEDSRSWNAFTYVLLAVHTVAVVTYLWLAWESSKGAPLEQHRRRRVPPLVLFVLLLYCTVAGLLVWGTVVLHSGSQDDIISAAGCSEAERGSWNVWAAAFAVVYGSWSALGIALLALATVFNLFADSQDPQSWVRRCGCLGFLLCCCSDGYDHAHTPRSSLLGQDLTPYQEIARTFAALLGQEDNTLSDYMLGITLVGIRQRLARQQQLMQPTDAKPGAGAAAASAAPPGAHVVSVTASSHSPAYKAGAAAGRGPPSGEVLRASTDPAAAPGTAGAAAAGAKPLQQGPGDVVTELQVSVTELAEVAAGSGSGEVDAGVMEDAVHYQRLVLAAYGWPMYLWSTRCKPLRWCDLCCGRGCGCCLSHPPTVYVRQDSGHPALHVAKRMHREAVQQFAHLPGSSLVWLSHENACEGLLPFFVCVDPTRRELIVSIRGTFSTIDCATDGLWTPVPLQPAVAGGTVAVAVDTVWAPEQVPAPSAAELHDVAEAGGAKPAGAKQQADSAGYCHSGVYHSAAAMCRKLEAVGVLEALLLGDTGARQRMEAAGLRSQHDCRGYSLMLTGHSLGAGVAAVLGLMLRPRFPALRVWALSPPGGLLSPQVSASMAPWCTSVVHAKDMVPRMSIDTLARLLDESMTAAALCRRNKAAVVWGSMWRGRWRAEELFWRSWEEVPGAVRQVLRQYEQDAQASRSALGAAFTIGRELVPPGRVIWVQDSKVPAPPGCFGGRTGGSGSGGTAESATAGATSSSNGAVQGGQGVAGECPGSTSSRAVPGGTGEDTVPGAVKRAYRAVWVTPGEVMGRGLLASRRMFWDHVPDVQLSNYVKAAKACPSSGSRGAGGRAAANPGEPDSAEPGGTHENSTPGLPGLAQTLMNTAGQPQTLMNMNPVYQQQQRQSGAQAITAAAVTPACRAACRHRVCEGQGV